MMWWQFEIVGYGIVTVLVAARRWPGTSIAPPFQLPSWKRLVDCVLVGLTWLPQAFRLLWMEL
jgi:hypothetical protein